MKTDELISLLAAGEGPPPPPADLRRLGIGAVLCVPLMAAAVAVTLGLVPPPMWPVSGTGPKLVYAALLLAGGVLLLRRLGRPGTDRALPLALIGGTLAIAQAIGLADLLRLPLADWPAHIRGHSALVCPLAILILSLPALAVTLRAARALAPTDLRLTGAAAGLAAGALGAAAYTLGCTEGALTFVALWYTLGMVLATALGALLGPRLLRW